jgi:hypothetical protein
MQDDFRRCCLGCCRGSCLREADAAIVQQIFLRSGSLRKSVNMTSARHERGSPPTLFVVMMKVTEPLWRVGLLLESDHHIWLAAVESASCSTPVLDLSWFCILSLVLIPACNSIDAVLHYAHAQVKQDLGKDWDGSGRRPRSLAHTSTNSARTGSPLRRPRVSINEARHPRLPTTDSIVASHSFAPLWAAIPLRCAHLSRCARPSRSGCLSQTSASCWPLLMSTAQRRVHDTMARACLGCAWSRLRGGHV